MQGGGCGVGVNVWMQQQRQTAAGQRATEDDFQFSSREASRRQLIVHSCCKMATHHWSWPYFQREVAQLAALSEGQLRWRSVPPRFGASAVDTPSGFLESTSFVLPAAAPLQTTQAKSSGEDVTPNAPLIDEADEAEVRRTDSEHSEYHGLPLD